MICVEINGYTRECATPIGGISKVWAFDPKDFNFTQVAPVGGVVNPYSAVARTAGATTTALMFPVNFEYEQGGYDATQSLNGNQPVWAHKLELQLAQNSQALTNFLVNMQVASSCCGVGFIIFKNDGKILVIGESIVNAAEIPRFYLRQNGTTLNTGKTFSEVDGANFIMTGNYSRPAYEFTGGISAITALQTYVAP